MSEIECPLEISYVDDELNNRLLKDFTGERTGFLQVGPDKWFLPSKYRAEASKLYNFKARPEDIWVVTFPRSGTTWTQELVWLVANNLDFETAKRIPQVERFPFLEFNLFVHDEVKAELLKRNADDPNKIAIIEKLSRPAYEMLEHTDSPRFIKTHLPFSLLPPSLLHVGCKVIYVARNPKDVAVSFYHLNRLFRTQGYKGDFSRYWDYFENNLGPWTPYWKHVKEGWDRRDHPNLLFLFYEEMNKDLPQTIDKIVDFLGREPLKDEQKSSLMQYLDINNFRKNSAVNLDMLRSIGMLNEGEEGFIRKGKSGGWKDEFSAELSRRADKWIKENLQQTNICFPCPL